MSQQSYNYIQTVATPRPGVFKVMLHLKTGIRNIGLIDFNGKPTYYTIRSTAHLHRKSQSLAINAEVVKRFKVVWVCVQYCGEMLWTKAKDLLTKGFVLNFQNKGFEPQIFLKLKDWAKKKEDDDDDMQGDLFQAA
jgi:hypothetical protein